MSDVMAELTSPSCLPRTYPRTPPCDDDCTRNTSHSVNQYGAPRAQALLVELVRLESRPARFLGIN